MPKVVGETEALYPGYKVLKIVDGHGLGEHTQMGWRLLEILGPSDVDHQISEDALLQGARPSNGYTEYNHQTVKLYKTVMKRVNLFLVGQTEHAADLQARFDDALAQVGFLEHDKEELAAENARLLEKIGKQVSLIEADGRTMQRIQDDVDKAKAANRRLEGDLAKVRQAIGDLKFREIVG